MEFVANPRRGMSLTTDTLTTFSANVNLVPNDSTTPAISFPMVQGIGFVTAIYQGATPFIDTSVFFNTITPLVSPSPGVTKYKLLLDDGNTWLLYATANGSGLALTSLNATRLEASGPFTGTIQVAKNPGDVAAQEALYDSCAGSYATTATLSASVDGYSGTYIWEQFHPFWHQSGVIKSSFGSRIGPLIARTVLSFECNAMCWQSKDLSTLLICLVSWGFYPLRATLTPESAQERIP